MYYYSLKIDKKCENNDFFVLNKNHLYFKKSSQMYKAYFSETTFRELSKKGKCTYLNQAKKEKMSLEVATSMENRILYTTESYMQDPPTKQVIEELILMCFVYENIKIEYVGRNLVKKDQENKKLLLENKDELISFDILGGKRKYYFKVRDLNFLFRRSDAKKEFNNLKSWFEDPESKVVLSLGSGGLRMFSIPAVLKVIDMIGARNYIKEIWGCSGGSIIGAPYSSGVSPRQLEQMGHDYYNERYEDFFMRKSMLGTFYNIVKGTKRLLTDSTGLVEVHENFKKTFENIYNSKETDLDEIPFFALATDVDSDRLSVLTEKKNITPACRELLIECNKVQAMIASAAIPFLFPAENINSHNEGIHPFVDGMMCEEVPLIYPYLKNLLEAKASALPESQHKKLKIFYVDLAPRVDEFVAFNKIKNMKGPLSKVAMAGKIFDQLFDSQIKKSVAILNAMPDVEVIGVRLKIDKFALLNGGEIPYIIQKSKSCFLEQLRDLNAELGEQKSFVRLHDNIINFPGKKKKAA